MYPRKAGLKSGGSSPDYWVGGALTESLLTTEKVTLATPAWAQAFMTVFMNCHLTERSARMRTRARGLASMAF